MRHSSKLFIPAALASVIFTTSCSAPEPEPVPPPPPVVVPPPAPTPPPVPPPPPPVTIPDVTPPPPVVPPVAGIPVSGPPSGGTPAGNRSANARTRQDAPVVAATTNNTENTEYCEAVGSFVVPSECVKHTTLQDKMKDGLSRFNPPREMYKGRPYDVRFDIDGKNTGSISVTEADKENGPLIAEVKIATFMGARLTNSGNVAKIEALDEEIKNLGGSTNASWMWRVTPQERGKLNLAVQLSPYTEKNPGSSEPRERFSKLSGGAQSKPIAVAVKVTSLGWLDWIKSLFGSMTEVAVAFGLLGGAIGLAFWRWRRIGSKPEEEDEPESKGGG